MNSICYPIRYLVARPWRWFGFVSQKKSPKDEHGVIGPLPYGLKSQQCLQRGFLTPLRTVVLGKRRLTAVYGKKGG